MLQEFLYVAIGLVLLFYGGDWLVKGAVSVAHRLNMSTLLVSILIVGFGTSTPELLVSVQAALAGSPDIALGNIIGSNTANVLLIMGLAAVITPVLCHSKGVKRDSLVVLLASLILLGLSFLGVIPRIAGIFMLLIMAGYIGYCIWQEKKSHDHDIEPEDHEQSPLSLSKSIGYCVVSLALLVVGARLLVDGASDIARGFGVSEAVIGLTLVAVGTSLPELAAAIAAAVKKHSDVMIGNILGSNLYNILGILGVTATIIPIPFSPQMAHMDIWLMVATAIVLLPIVWLGEKRISRVQGGLFLVIYLIYVGWLYTMTPSVVAS